MKKGKPGPALEHGAPGLHHNEDVWDAVKNTLTKRMERHGTIDLFAAMNVGTGERGTPFDDITTWDVNFRNVSSDQGRVNRRRQDPPTAACH